MKKYILLCMTLMINCVSLEASYSNKYSTYKPQDRALYYNIQHHIIELINKEKKAIQLAMYTFTSAEIAEALVNARQRGVSIEVVLDLNCCNQFPAMQQVALGLATNGISVKCLSLENGGHMHHKFLLLECNGSENNTVIVNGSYNYTKTAEENSEENVMIVYNSPMLKTFKEMFANLIN